MSGNKPFNIVDLTDWDEGLVGVIREIMLIGTEKVKEKNLLEKGYELQGATKSRMMKNYPVYSVCYMKEKHQDYFNLMAIARI